MHASARLGACLLAVPAVLHMLRVRCELPSGTAQPCRPAVHGWHTSLKIMDALRADANCADASAARIHSTN